MASNVDGEIGEEQVSLASSESIAAEIIHEKTEVVIEIGPGDLPPPKKRGRPRKINNESEKGQQPKIFTESEAKFPPKKKARTYKEDDEWMSPVVPVRSREAVVTRTRTGRTPRRSIYGDDFVSPFDTKTIRAELDKATKSASSSGETLKRGRGRPPKKVSAPLIQQNAEQMYQVQPPSEIIVIETVEAPVDDAEVVTETVQSSMETVTVEIIKASEARNTEGTQTLTVEVVPPQEEPVEATPVQSPTQSVEAAPNDTQIVQDTPVQVQEIPTEVVVTPKKKRGRPPKRKEAEPEMAEDLVDPDADLLEDADQGAIEMEEEITAEEQEQLEMLEINGENDFMDSNETEKEVLEALLTQDVREEALPVDQARSVRHLSAAADVNDLLPDRCCPESDEPGCSCGLFHCPLCTVEYFKPVNYARVISKHLCIHEKYGVRFLDVTCCPCRLDCQEIRMPHFHCPACGIIKLTKTTFQKHLDTHGDVTFILDAQWKTRQKQAASSPTVTPKKVPQPILDEPVLSNVTAVLTTEFLEHIGAMENTESFLKEKLAMEKVFVTKVSDQWIIHGQWEHIQKAYARLKKLHKEAKIQKLKDKRSNEAEEVQHVTSGEQTVSVLGQTLVIPKQEVTEDSAGSPVVDSGVGPEDQDIDKDDPDYEVKPRVRRTKDEIKALGIKLKCRTCGLIKHSKDALYRHIWRCHKEKVHECSKCGRSYGQRSDMARHQETCKGRRPILPDPEGDGPYKCDVCGKLLMTRETLKAHHKYIHTDSGACVCHLCGKNFRAPRYLKSHLVRHSDVRNYVCGICGKSFKERGTLKEHLGTHKDPSEREKKFKCELCPKTYFRHAALLDHMNFHAGRKPYSCGECGKTFIGRCALQKHLLSHIETKSFDCDRCGKSFKFRHKLESHFVTHTGFSKHVCSICGKCFTTSTTLRKHNCKGSFQVDKSLVRNQNALPIDSSTSKQTLQLYMCSLCNLTFTEWTDVAGHMLLHNEVSDGGVENSSDGTVQIELQSQDLINLADAAAASASLAASGDASQEDMQSVINAIAQVQRMENADGELDDDVSTETQRALAQIEYNQIQIQDSNIVNVIQDGQDEPRQVTIHLEDNEQYQIVQEQLAANPEQFQIIEENAGEDRGQFQLIQGVSDDSQGQYQVIQDVEQEGTFNYQVIQGDGVGQRYRIIQGEPGSQGQFQIIQSEASGEFQVVRGNALDQGNFQVNQGEEDQGQYQVIQETPQDGDFDVLQEGSEGNQFHVVPGSEGGEGTITITAPQTSEHSELSCNIGDMPLEHVEQLTAVTHIAMDPANRQECMVETELVESGNGDPIYDEMQGEVMDSPSVVVMTE